MSEAFIYDAVRTPRGKNRDGALHSVKPIDLVTGLIDAVRERNPELDDKAIDDLVLGVVSPVGEQRSEEHTSELQSRGHLVCRLLLEKKKTQQKDQKHRPHHYRYEHENDDTNTKP